MDPSPLTPYEEFMHHHRQSSSQKRVTHHSAGVDYVINDHEYPIFARLFYAEIEAGRPPVLEVKIPTRRRTHLMLHLSGLSYDTITPSIDRLEKLIVRFFKLTDSVSYRIDTLESSHYDYRLYWYSGDEPLLATPLRVEQLVAEIRKDSRELGRIIHPPTERVPLVGSSIVDADSGRTDRFLPLCRKEIEADDLFDFGLLGLARALVL